MELKCRRLSSTAMLQLADNDDSASLATILNNLARRWRRFRLLIVTIQLCWQRFRSPIVGNALGRQSRRFSSVGDDLARRWWRFSSQPFISLSRRRPFASPLHRRRRRRPRGPWRSPYPKGRSDPPRHRGLLHRRLSPRQVDPSPTLRRLHFPIL